MSMSVGARRGGVVAEINVTPMADVMIVLLIIFMVATPLIVTSPVALPRAREAVERKGDDVKVVVKAHGEISIGSATFGDAATLGAAKAVALEHWLFGLVHVVQVVLVELRP